MISIERSNDRFVIRAKNPGSGMRGWSFEAKTLRGVHLIIDHYLAHATHYPKRNCPICREKRKETQ